MNETTPKYIIELKKHIDNKFDKVEEKLDKHDKRFDKIEETLHKHGKKLDTHFETIGTLKVQVTGIDTRIKDIEKVMFVS